MPTKNPRINVMLEERLYQSIQYLARKEGVSLSLKARDLKREALETHEDVLLSDFAETRESTFKRSKALSHEETWSL